MERVDLVVRNASQVVTMAGTSGGPKRGREMSEIGLVRRGFVAARGGRVVAAGPEAEMDCMLSVAGDAVVVDAGGGVVTPGLVDPHTHAVFMGWRAEEFAMRLKGVPYLEILSAGGGILSTVRRTREAGEEELVSELVGRLDEAVSWGTTTMEVKSGYGLSTAEEMKLLRVLGKASEVHPVDIVPTFMGAHAIPPEFKGDPDGYVEVVVREMIPAVAEKRLAVFCDVFCETGVFSIEQSRRVLKEGLRYGLRPKIHADELTDLGGAGLAAELKAVSAEHLLRISAENILRMRDAGCIGVLLPGTPFFLGEEEYAPARTMIEAGLPVALGTDFNPGTCTIQSLPIIMGIACTRMRMTPEECLSAVTINAAHAIGLGGSVGSLEPGKKADIAVFDVEDYREIPYRFGTNLIRTVIKDGRVVVDRSTRRN